MIEDQIEKACSDQLEAAIEEIADAKALVSIAVRRLEQAHAYCPDGSEFYEAALIGVYNSQMHIVVIEDDLTRKQNRANKTNAN